MTPLPESLFGQPQDQMNDGKANSDTESLPLFTDESLRAIPIEATTSREIYTVNLLDYTCSNPICQKIHSDAPPRDIGRLCKHIIFAIRNKKLLRHLPPIARGIAENGMDFGYPAAFGVHPGRFAKDIDGNTIYISGKDEKGWISVYAFARRNGKKYYRFGFHVEGRRWTRLTGSGLINRTQPRVDESIVY